jgi:hypothetical protein
MRLGVASWMRVGIGILLIVAHAAVGKAQTPLALEQVVRLLWG